MRCLVGSGLVCLTSLFSSLCLFVKIGRVPQSSSHERMKGKYKPLAHWVKKQRDELAAYEKNQAQTEKGEQEQDAEEDQQQQQQQQHQPSCRSLLVRMTEERRTALLDLGLTAAVLDRKDRWVEIERERWQEKFELLQQYNEEYGNCTCNNMLYVCCVYVCMYVCTFSKIDIIFCCSCVSPHTYTIHRSKKYIIISGNVPTWSNHTKLQGKYKPLAHWVRQQRSDLAEYDKKDADQETLRMTAKRKQLLLDLGFGDQTEEKSQWAEVEKERWPSRFELLKQYKEEYGDCKHLLIYRNDYTTNRKNIGRVYVWIDFSLA
jgi:hypothetical protein